MARWLPRAARFGFVALLLLACRPAAAPAAPSAAAPAPASSAPVASAPAPAAASAPAEPVTIRAAMIPSLASAPFLAGSDLGILEANGIQLDITPFTDTAAIMTQLAAGRLDIGHVTVGSATLNAFSRGVDITIAAAGSLAGSPIMIRKDLVDDGTFRSLADLRGRRISINTRGVIHEYVLYKVLQSGGLSMDDVEIPLLPWPDQVTALGNQAIEAGIVVEPIASQAVARGVAALYEPPDAAARGEPWFEPGLQGGMIMVNRQWAEANPTLATAVVKSYLQAARRLQGRRIYDDDTALAAVERWAKVTPEAVRRSIPTYWALNGQLHVESLMNAQRYFMESGGANYREPLTIQALHDDRYLEAALREIGIVPDGP